MRALQDIQAGGELSTFLSTSAKDFVRSSLSDNTLRAYSSCLQLWADWCLLENSKAMPASPVFVANYVAHLAGSGLSVATIRQRIAAIGWAHRINGKPDPTSAPHVRATLKGVVNRLGVSPENQKHPLTAAMLGIILHHLPSGTLASLRDRAVLLLGFAGAFRRSELAALTIEDLTFTENGLDVCVRRSKTDQEGKGCIVAIPKGRRLKPVAAIKRWIEAAEIEEGWLFRPVNRGDNLEPGGLSDRSIAQIVKRHTAGCGLQGDFGGHSLRSGFVTSAAEAGASLDRIMDVTRHRNPQTVLTYIRHADRYQDHAGTKFL